MKRRISLYIGGKSIDLDSESFVLFNYTRDEASNPTIVRNSYSQSISIPATKNNNDVFGRLFRLDSTTFNPLQKVEFIIYNELNEILERGYARLDSITTQGAKATYKVSLFGGLGGFFYSLMYDEEGNKKTLADMEFIDPQDERGTIKPIEYTFPLLKSQVRNAWQSISGAYPSAEYELINFAPCNNGKPSYKFSTNKAIYKLGSAGYRFPNLYVTDTKDGITYKSKNDDDTILLEMGEEHSEWEVEDLRAYRQRPVIRFRKFVESLERAVNTGSFTFRIDTGSEFFRDSNPYWANLWMSLSLIDRDKVDPASTTLADLLKGTNAPAEYLISFAKLFGLVFVVDNASNTITLTDRNGYYTNETIDLTSRVSPDKEITPRAMEAKYYDFAYPSVYGEFAKNYEEKYSRKYGLQRVNTGYDFNTDHEDTLKDIVFKGCSDVLESSINMAYYLGDVQGQYGEAIDNDFKFAFTDSVSWKLYGKQNGKDVEITATPRSTYMERQGYTDNAYRDFMTRPQLHGEENKGEDGANVLLFFEGMINTPVDVVSGFVISSSRFHISDDSQAMLDLNGGEPCYDVTYGGSNVVEVYALPSFRRWHFVNGVVNRTLDPGTPLEVSVPETANPYASIYHLGWEDYIADKFSKDTRIVNLKVDFSGMKVDGELLRKFYYFGNSLWVLNKITNYSLTTYDDVECEFIKVGDTDSYIFGQLY